MDENDSVADELAAETKGTGIRTKVLIILLLLCIMMFLLSPFPHIQLILYSVILLSCAFLIPGGMAVAVGWLSLVLGLWVRTGNGPGDAKRLRVRFMDSNATMTLTDDGMIIERHELSPHKRPPVRFGFVDMAELRKTGGGLIEALMRPLLTESTLVTNYGRDFQIVSSGRNMAIIRGALRDKGIKVSDG